MMRDVLLAVILTCGGRKIHTAASKKFALTLGPKRRRVQAIIEQRSRGRGRRESQQSEASRKISRHRFMHDFSYGHEIRYGLVHFRRSWDAFGLGRNRPAPPLAADGSLRAPPGD
jgi:hypothetical protein